MDPYNGVFTLNILRSGFGILAIEIRMSRTVDGGPAINNLAERGRELLICSIPTCPKGISSDCRDSIIV
jgi:hypothetical protein